MPIVSLRPRRPVRSGCRPCLLAVALLLPSAALGEPLAAGDGSWATNPQLFSTVPLAEDANWAPVAPADANVPFYDLDWSLTTTGALIRDSSGQRFKTSLLPSISLTHNGRVVSFGATAGAIVSKTDGGALSIDQLQLSGRSAYQVDPRVKLENNASLSLSKEDPNAPDVASDVADTPTQLSGSVDSAYTRSFGRFSATLRGSVGRDVYGATTLIDGTSLDNTDQNNTRFGTGLRLGYELTPVLAVFVDADAQRSVFDAPSTSLGTSLDGNLYTLLAGATAKWGATLSASVSGGVGVEHFDDPALAEVRATLYNASLTYQPTEALAVTGSFATSIGAPGPNGGGTARIAQQAAIGAAYRVNDWLGWRASAGWYRYEYAGTDTVDSAYNLGVGADYLVSRQVKLSADYNFQRGAITPSPVSDTQTISLGVTVSK